MFAFAAGGASPAWVLECFEMRSRKAPQIRLDSAKAIPQVLFQASFAAFILYALTVSANIVKNSIQDNSIGHHMEVSHFCVLFRSLFK